MDANSTTQAQPDELTFDLKITNGAAKKLDSLMKYFDYETAKEVIGLSLELLDAVKEGQEIVVKKKDGTAKQLIITPKSNGKDHVA